MQSGICLNVFTIGKNARSQGEGVSCAKNSDFEIILIVQSLLHDS